MSPETDITKDNVMITLARFRGIVANVLSGLDKKLSDKSCPDKWVGYIGRLEQPFKYKEICEAPAQNGRVFLILESPHTAELKGVVNPAKGNTGKNIVELWDKFIGAPNSGLPDSAGLPLCVVNAVKYQCSLGLPLSRFRGVKDEIFKQVIKNNVFLEDLHARLEKYELSRKDRVVVACSNDHDVSEVVAKVIDSFGVITRRNFVRCYYHPAYWRLGLNRQNRLKEGSR